MYGAAAGHIFDGAAIAASQRADVGIRGAVRGLRTRNIDIAQAQVAHAAGRANIAEHRCWRLGAVDGQAIQFMAQAIKLASEWRAGAANGHKALANVPAARGAGIDIAAQDIVAR